MISFTLHKIGKLADQIQPNWEVFKSDFVRQEDYNMPFIPEGSLQGHTQLTKCFHIWVDSCNQLYQGTLQECILETERSILSKLPNLWHYNSTLASFTGSGWYAGTLYSCFLCSYLKNPTCTYRLNCTKFSISTFRGMKGRFSPAQIQTCCSKKFMCLKP